MLETESRELPACLESERATLGGAVTDGGAVIDTGERWDEQGHALQPDDDPQQRIADRINAELQTQQSAEETAQWLQSHEQEQAAAEHEEQFQAALAHYDQLPPEEQYEVANEITGRGLEAITPLVDASYANALNTELFAGQADAVAMTATLAYFGNNALQTLESAGLSPAELTPEVVSQLNDPVQASLFAENLCGALGMPELISAGVVNPQEMAAALLPWVPVLLSGNAADAYAPETALGFAQALLVAFGQEASVQNIDPAFAAATFGKWMAWGGHLGSELRRVRAGTDAQSTRASRRTSAKPSLKWGNSDIFDDEAIAVWQSRHGGV
jgi:hypothetical protein